MCLGTDLFFPNRQYDLVVRKGVRNSVGTQSDEATAKPSEPVWAGWALPVDSDDKLSISMYGSDVLAFATAFLTRCGFVKAPAAISSESFVSIEDSTRQRNFWIYICEGGCSISENSVQMAGLMMARLWNGTLPSPRPLGLGAVGVQRMFSSRSGPIWRSFKAYCRAASP